MPYGSAVPASINVHKPLRPARPRAKYRAMTTRTPLTGPVVWQGKDIKDSRRWIRDLPVEALDELDAAVKSVRGMPWQEITREDFALPTISDLLDDVADELENGSGIMKLRGIPVDRYSEDELRQMYFGLGTHIGTPVFQNRSGELMRAICAALDSPLPPILEEQQAVA